MRARAEIQLTARDREQIIVTEIPYQVNKAQLLERIGELVREKTIEGISDIRDESDRQGIRIVIEVKRDDSADIVLNQLYRHTRLQTSFAVNMLAMHAGRPQQMGLKTVLSAFCAFRQEVVTRRTRFQLGKARERAHTLAGLLVALASIDEIIEASKDSTLEEAFGTGTAVGVAMIQEIGYQSHTIHISDKNPVGQMVLETLNGVRTGKIPDSFNWMCSVKV